jgi:hypothetical protein
MKVGPFVTPLVLFLNTKKFFRCLCLRQRQLVPAQLLPTQDGALGTWLGLGRPQGVLGGQCSGVPLRHVTERTVRCDVATEQ